MNIDISWDRPYSNALVCRFSGDWTWHECKEAMQVVMYLQEGSPIPLRCIYDFTDSTLPSRAALNRLQKLLMLSMHPAPEQIVIVDKGHRLTTLEAMLGNITSTMEHIQFEDCLDRARRLIA